MIHDQVKNSTSIPHELLGYIFEHCLESVRHPPSVIGTPRWFHPFVLASICREWRAVATSAVRLWNDIRIPLYPIGLDSVNQQEMVASCLQRSGSLPLFIYICHRVPSAYAPTAADLDAGEPHPAMAVLNTHLHRFQFLHLRVPITLASQLVGTNVGSPILDEIKIHVEGVPFHKTNADVLVELNTTVPISPRKLDVWGFHEIKMSTFSKANLREVSFEQFFVQELLQLLHDAPLLEDFDTFYLAQLDETRGFPSQPPTQPLVHRNLRSLTWSDTNVDFPVHFFENVTLPSLQTFRFCSRRDAVDCLHTFIMRSSPPLTWMSWTEADMLSIDAVDILRLCGQLEELDFRDCDFSFNNIFETLANDPTFLPRLTHLSIELNSYAGTLDWHYIPPIFGPNTENPQRNLRLFLEIEADLDAEEYVGPRWIPADLLPAFQSLRQAGVLSIGNAEDVPGADLEEGDGDFIQQSAAFYQSNDPSERS